MWRRRQWILLRRPVSPSLHFGRKVLSLKRVWKFLLSCSFSDRKMTTLLIIYTVLRIRDVYPGSWIWLFSIPDPNSFHPGSRIQIKEFKYFNPKKWFLSSREYDPGCSSRIRIQTFYPSRISDPGVKKASDPGSGSATLNFYKVYFELAEHISSGIISESEWNLWGT